MDDRRRQPEYSDSSRRHEVHREDWHGADHRSLSSEGRHEQSSRPEFHSARWLPALPELQRRGSWRRCPREEIEEEISHKSTKSTKGIDRSLLCFLCL